MKKQMLVLVISVLLLFFQSCKFVSDAFFADSLLITDVSKEKDQHYKIEFYNTSGTDTIYLSNFRIKTTVYKLGYSGETLVAYAQLGPGTLGFHQSCVMASPYYLDEQKKSSIKQYFRVVDDYKIPAFDSVKGFIELQFNDGSSFRTIDTVVWGNQDLSVLDKRSSFRVSHEPLNSFQDEDYHLRRKNNNKIYLDQDLDSDWEFVK